ncbi:hypothetical protein MVEG_08116 [Podila verticillata NRRL 6337]|nr:hypothetical protein MVEG_08116 [Podila verticillata NRRL 6337]
MAAASPLDIPEILSLIASFVPVWESAWEGPSHELKFVPWNLLSCTLVCKSWRRDMLPQLWAVYSERHMYRIPTKVLAQNSIFFRRLKSFTLTSTSYQPQYELLCTNSGIVSLQWTDFKPFEAAEFLDVLRPLGTTLKELRVHFPDIWSARAPFVLMDVFPKLERLRLSALSCGNGVLCRTFLYASAPVPDLFAFLESSRSVNRVQYPSVKQLTVPASIFGTPRLFLQLLSHCPRIEHLVVEMDLSITTALVPLVQLMVLRWQAVYKVWISYLDTTPRHPLLEATGHDYPGLEKLDTLLDELDQPHTWLRARVERRCENLMGLSACLSDFGVKMAAPLIGQSKYTLRDVDLHCKVGVTSSTAYVLLSRILKTIPALRRLRFVSETTLSEKESIAIFQNGLQQDDQHGGIAGTTRALAQEARGTWVCRNLESLIIKGLWRTASKGRPSNIHKPSMVLQTASARHQWVVRLMTLGEHSEKIISARIQTLPALRTFILNRIVFEYVEIQ